jgi:hypothetical protein
MPRRHILLYEPGHIPAICRNAISRDGGFQNAMECVKKKRPSHPTAFSCHKRQIASSTSLMNPYPSSIVHATESTRPKLRIAGGTIFRTISRMAGERMTPSLPERRHLSKILGIATLVETSTRLNKILHIPHFKCEIGRTDVTVLSGKHDGSFFTANATVIRQVVS